MKTAKKKQSKPTTGLSGFVVIWRHNMDDVPVGLFKTEKEALAAAKKISLRSAYAVAKKLDIDCRTPVCFAVVAFKDGRPAGMTIIDRPDDA